MFRNKLGPIVNFLEDFAFDNHLMIFENRNITNEQRGQVLKLSLYFNLVLLISCSSIKFRSSDIVPISLEENPMHKLDVNIIVEKPFYFWGMMPGEHLVEIDKLFEAKGISEASDLEIIEIEQNRKFMWMILSLGLYYPQTFELVAKSTQ